MIRIGIEGFRWYILSQCTEIFNEACSLLRSSSVVVWPDELHLTAQGGALTMWSLKVVCKMILAF